MEIRISELDLVTTLQNADFLATVQDGVTSKITGNEVAFSVKSIANLTDKVYVDTSIATAIANLIDGAPQMLDTLKELADAIGNDSNFYNDLMAALNNKLNDSSFQTYFDSSFAGKNTYHLTEGSNLYYTPQRVLDLLAPQITTETLNVKDIVFTGTGIVDINSGNDLQLNAAGEIFINGKTTEQRVHDVLDSIPPPPLPNRLVNGEYEVVLGADGTVTLTSGSNIYDDGGALRFDANKNIQLSAYDSGAPATWTFGTDGNLTLPEGGTIGETATTTVITPPGASAGQSLVIRPTSSTWSVTASDYITYGSPITVTVSQTQVGYYFGTINYVIAGVGVTEQSLGRPLTGHVVITRAEGQSSQPVTWTIPANSNITEFTFTLTTVDGTRSNDIVNETDPALYYNFEYNAMPTGYYVTVTSNGMSNFEASHIHLVAGDPTTTDLYLGDDDQYVKIEKAGGAVVIGTDANTNHWTFGTDGDLTLPSGLVFDRAHTSIRVGQGFHITSGEGVNIRAIDETDPNNLIYKNWIFRTDGSLLFPDYTVQTTAYTGSTSTLVNGTYTVALSTTGQLNLPGAANTESSNARIQSANNIDVLSNLSLWTFGTDGKLTLPAGGDIVDSTGASVLGGGSGGGPTAWTSVTGKPSFATVATSGSYADLINKPVLFSGSYADLTNKPTLFSGSYNDLTNKPTAPTFTTVTTTDLNVQNVTLTGGGPCTFTSGNDLNFVAAGDITFNGKQLVTSYNDLLNTPYLPGRKTLPPTSSVGATGDRAGDWAIDESYLYYCHSDYSAQLTTINITFGSAGTGAGQFQKLEGNPAGTVVTEQDFQSWIKMLNPTVGQWKFSFDTFIDAQGHTITIQNIPVLTVTLSRVNSGSQKQIGINFDQNRINNLPNFNPGGTYYELGSKVCILTGRATIWRRIALNSSGNW